MVRTLIFHIKNGGSIPPGLMMSIYFKLISYYSFKSYKNKIKVSSLVLFRVIFMLLISSIYKTTIGYSPNFFFSKKFIIAKSTHPVTIIKAPMAHKKWSKEQISSKFYLFIFSLNSTNPMLNTNSSILFIKILISLASIKPENSAVFLKSLRLKFYLNKKISI